MRDPASATAKVYRPPKEQPSISFIRITSEISLILELNHPRALPVRVQNFGK